MARARGRKKTAWAYDYRTGMKVNGDRLIEDGEKSGVWTLPENADPTHPQRFRRPPGPDGTYLKPARPAPHAIPAVIRILPTSNAPQMAINPRPTVRVIVA